MPEFAIPQITKDLFVVFRRAAEGEAWKHDHNDAMQVRDLEQFIVTGLAVAQTLEMDVAAINAATDKGIDCYSTAIAQYYAARWQHWLQAFRHVEPDIVAFENRGYQVDGADKLREFAIRVARECLDGDMIAIADCEQKYRPLNEAICVLRRPSR